MLRVQPVPGPGHQHPLGRWDPRGEPTGVGRRHENVYVALPEAHGDGDRLQLEAPGAYECEVVGDPALAGLAVGLELVDGVELTARRIEENVPVRLRQAVEPCVRGRVGVVQQRLDIRLHEGFER